MGRQPQCLPTVWLVLAGILVAYLFFFIGPVFLNSEGEMQFISYIPARDPIGIDLKQMLAFSESWISSRVSSCVGENCASAVSTLLFSTMLTLDHANVYTIIVAVTLLGYLFCAIIFPVLCSKNRDISPVIILMFISGLFSYGLQFELERGQTNIIAISLSFLAIYLFHYHYRFRYYAYLLFSISVQLKLYPAIFIFMFTHDMRDWRKNIVTFLMIVLFNVALLFVLGQVVALEFLHSIASRIGQPYVWAGNHSIQGFFGWLLDGLEGHSYWGATILGKYIGLLTILSLAFFLCCLGTIIWTMWKKRMSGLNPYLLLSSTIGALLIPSESQDYKLSVLIGPLAIFLNAVEIGGDRMRIWLLRSSVILAFGFAYGTTLFSYTNKPPYLYNNFPALMIILIGMISLFITKERSFTLKTLIRE